MTTGITCTDSVSINDFNDKCRICLKNYKDMIDIYTSGISNQIMEVTNVKISCNDKLPRNMCNACNAQLKELHKFQCLAKDSDKYLRTLLNTEKCLDQSAEVLPEKNIQGKKRKIHSKFMRLKPSRKFKGNLQNDKMYLILVTDASNNTGDENEICIRDLDEEDTELINICKSLMENHTGECNHLHENIIEKTPVDLTEDNNKDAYNVNLVIYDCNECEESFELKESLIDHVKSIHETETLDNSFNYTCPVCLKSESDNTLFMNHLTDHKKQGLVFYKVDKSGSFMNLTQLEKEIFEMPKIMDDSLIRNKIYKMNTYSYTCYMCKKVESVNSINEHLKLCYPNLKEDDYHSYHIKYTCPACCESWIDDVGAMNAHLLSHRTNNVFFVKVNEFGQSIGLSEEDIAFTEFEKALELLKFDNVGFSDSSVKTKIIKMLDFCFCVICDFHADSLNSLFEHYLKIHDNVIAITKMSCPVCSENFKFVNLDESVKYLDHLKNHKFEGIVFLRINKNGSIVNKPDEYELFSDLNDLFSGKVPCPELEFIASVYVPEVYLNNQADRYICDSAHGELLSKEEIIGHLRADNEEGNRSSREYVCEKCGRKCFGRGNYKRHFMTHAEKSEVLSAPKHPSCSVCKKIFSNRTALNEHKKYHFNTESDSSGRESGRKMCEICGRKLSNNASLAKHRRLHVSDRESALLKCKFCEREFRREPALNRHVSYHLNPNYFECEVCKLPLPSSASLQRHKLWHQGSSNTYDCKVCKLSFITKDRLTAHQTQTGHHQDKKRFECNVCHERFFIGREFSQHIKLHPKYKMSECSLCGKRLSTMQSLVLHLSRHFESNSILCPHCGKQFFEERNYHRHLLTHKGVKPFSCDVEGCKKSFYTYFELNRHKKYHNNTRDFSCPYCPKSFHEANHLKVHIRTHTGERPYTCPHCNKGFVTRTRCKQHINLIHQGVGCDLIRSNISKKVAVFEALETVS